MSIRLIFDDIYPHTMSGDTGAAGEGQPSRSGVKSIAELLNDTLVPQLEEQHIDDDEESDGEGEDAGEDAAAPGAAGGAGGEDGGKKKKKKKKKKSKAKAPVVKLVAPARLWRLS